MITQTATTTIKYFEVERDEDGFVVDKTPVEIEVPNCREEAIQQMQKVRAEAKARGVELVDIQGLSIQIQLEMIPE